MERAAFSVGKNRSVRPSADTMREAAMSVTDGVEVGDHRLRLRTYQQCFVAARCVDWLQERFEFARDEALEFCQQMLDDGWMKHSNGSASRFTDSAEELFQWCQQRSMFVSSQNCSLPIFTRAPRGAIRSIDLEGSEERGSSILSSSFPNSPQQRKSLQKCLVEVDTIFELVEPSFSTGASENRLQIAICLQCVPHLRNLRALSLNGLKLTGDVFLMCMSLTLKKMHSLEKLDISQNQLGASCVIRLFERLE